MPGSRSSNPGTHATGPWQDCWNTSIIVNMEDVFMQYFQCSDVMAKGLWWGRAEKSGEKQKGVDEMRLYLQQGQNKTKSQPPNSLLQTKKHPP